MCEYVLKGVKRCSFLTRRGFGGNLALHGRWTTPFEFTHLFGQEIARVACKIFQNVSPHKLSLETLRELFEGQEGHYY